MKSTSDNVKPSLKVDKPSGETEDVKPNAPNEERFAGV